MIQLEPGYIVCTAILLRTAFVRNRPSWVMRCACGEEFARVCGHVNNHATNGWALTCDACRKRRADRKFDAKRAPRRHVVKGMRTDALRKTVKCCGACAGYSWRRPLAGCPACKGAYAPERIERVA